MALVRGREVLTGGVCAGGAVGVAAVGAGVGVGVAAGGCCGMPGNPGGNVMPGGSWMDGRVVGSCKPLGSGNGS